MDSDVDGWSDEIEVSYGTNISDSEDYPLDADGDGIPDTWETTNGLNPLDATDASLDPDGDGLTNLQEYQENTDPNSYFSPFPVWIASVAVVVVIGTAIVVYFVKVRKPAS